MVLEIPPRFFLSDLIEQTTVPSTNCQSRLLTSLLLKVSSPVFVLIINLIKPHFFPLKQCKNMNFELI